MAVEFLIGNSQLPMEDGIPAGYPRYILHGGQALHCKNDFGSIVTQELQTELAFFRIIHMHFERAANIRCKYLHNETILFSRISPNPGPYELLKGGGRIRYDKHQFECLFGWSWQSLVKSDGTGDCIFYDIGWKEKLIRSRLKKKLAEELNKTAPGFPNRIAGRRFFLSFQMNALLHAFLSVDYRTRKTEFFNREIEKYLTLMLNRMLKDDWDMLGVKQLHWDAVERARQYLIDHPDEDVTIPFLSERAFTSATNLKKYFRHITGFTIEQFKMFVKLKPTLHLLATTNKPVKDICSTAYYSSPSPYCEAFRTIFLCSPTEIRGDDWDTSGL